MANLPGMKLYAARGHTVAERVHFDIGHGESIEFVSMRKAGNTRGRQLVAP